MTPLLVLGFIMLALWVFGVLERDRRAYFMRQWVHVPFVAGVIVLLMALGTALR